MRVEGNYRFVSWDWLLAEKLDVKRDAGFVLFTVVPGFARSVYGIDSVIAIL